MSRRAEYKTSETVKIFICEHACSALPPGANNPVPAGFRGDVMLQSLLGDICRIDDVSVSVLRAADNAVIDLPGGTTVMQLPRHNPWPTVDACIRDAEAIWPLAPESNGLLESISKRILQHRKILLGSTPDAVHLAGSKYRTSQALRAANIAVVQTWRTYAGLPANIHALVVKPDDGAGCSDTHIFPSQLAGREWIGTQAGGDYVLQPYLYGRPCSLSLLCGNDEMFLLGCNDQRVAVSDNQFHYLGSTVNSIDDDKGEFKRLARRVIDAIPGLWGYVGIDLIVTNQGPVVLEVNPRMTMSHAGLHASIGANPAAMLFDMLRIGHCAVPAPHKNRQISIDVNDTRLGVDYSAAPSLSN